MVMKKPQLNNNQQAYYKERLRILQEMAQVDINLVPDLEQLIPPLPKHITKKDVEALTKVTRTTIEGRSLQQIADIVAPTSHRISTPHVYQPTSRVSHESEPTRKGRYSEEQSSQQTNRTYKPHHLSEEEKANRARVRRAKTLVRQAEKRGYTLSEDYLLQTYEDLSEVELKNLRDVMEYRTETGEIISATERMKRARQANIKIAQENPYEPSQYIDTDIISTSFYDTVVYNFMSNLEKTAQNPSLLGADFLYDWFTKKIAQYGTAVIGKALSKAQDDGVRLTRDIMYHYEDAQVYLADLAPYMYELGATDEEISLMAGEDFEQMMPELTDVDIYDDNPFI